MKKTIILSTGLTTLLMLSIFVSCTKKESLIVSQSEVKANTNDDIFQNREGDISVNSPEVLSIIQLPTIKSKLESKNITSFETAHKQSINNSNWEAFELTKTVSETEKVTLLYVTDSRKKIVMPYLATTTFSNNIVIKVSIKSLITDVLIGEKFATSSGLAQRPTCLESTSNFNDCFHCAMNELTSDLLGTIACTAFPFSCVIASSLACGCAIAYIPQQGTDQGSLIIDTDSKVTVFINTVISNGVFSLSTLENNTYILN